GTGKSLQNPYFKIAGKTGTAQVATGQEGYKKGMYLASFAGYFPADNPRYSMIVTFNNPRGGAYYGGSVAGPVFKEIAEKVYASQILIEELREVEEEKNTTLPEIKNGKPEDILKLAEELKIEGISGNPGTALADVKNERERVILSDAQILEGAVPDVSGMSVSDAVFILENSGLQVKISGVGKVKKQSLSPGIKFRRGQTIYLTLG
ncbi:MAG TPA: penicillin-binding transpeptidase domain-containing protein, partial [Draconibacterium sp.]|nr:penicillin-binding transpeptidase domain-containing protein [Draconibacterium sp.]